MFKIRFLFFSFILFFCSNAHGNEYHELWTKCGLFNYSQKIDFYNYFNTKTREQRTAYHEAGHALTCVLLGKKILKATIISDKNKKSDGSVLFLSVPYSSNETIKIFLAGYAAEEIIYGQACLGIKSDLEMATEVASQLCSAPINTQDDVINQLKNELAQTKLLISNNFPLLEKIAQELLAKKELTGDEIYEIVNNG